ncbi:MAG: DUF4270 family protein [Bacteroidetes bacterium]|nr:DUF4270 family protein [Bacteroidota bacterium]
MLRIICLICLLCEITGCTKTEVDLRDNQTTEDPNIVYYENYPLDIGTYKTDSFRTSGHSIFTAGYHRDPITGNFHAATFAELVLPAVNPLLNQDVSFDSLVLVIKPNGQYYGDTLQPIRLSVLRLEENIRNEDDADVAFYSPRYFATSAVPLAQKTMLIRPAKDTLINLRLPDAFGAELMQKLKTNAAEIQDNTAFIKYLKGFCIDVDTALSNTLFYFSATGGTTLMRLHYKLNSTVSVQKVLNFQYNSNRQTNYLHTNHPTGLYSLFTPYKKQFKTSEQLGHKAILNSNAGSYIRFNFPEILNIREKFPFVKILKAELVIRPAAGTYSYPYSLPPALHLYTSGENNLPSEILLDPTGQYQQTGDLRIDPLYSNGIKYTYDITSFLSALTDAGPFNKTGLVLVPPTTFSDEAMHRLIVNDQLGGNGIQLKLYVLGI